MRKAAWFFFVLAIFAPGCGDKTSSPDENSGGNAAGAPAAPETESTSGAILPSPPQPAPKTDHIPGGYSESRPAIEGFLTAPTWQERLPYIYGSERLRDRVEAYYANHPDGPIENYHLKFLSMDETPSDGDYPLYVFTLHLPDQAGEFPVTIRKTPDGMRVDWEIFTEFRDGKFRQFVESGDGGPAALRVILQRQSYWGADRDAMTEMLSFRLMTMDPNVELFAFVPKDSPLAETMDEFYGWGVGPIAATVVVERREFPQGNSHFVITRLATHPLAGDGWHVR